MQLTCVRLVVEGIVQGVGFRFFTKQQAEKHNITGWVKNKENGTVEIVAEGERDQVDRFIEKVRKGPLGSRVEHVSMETETPSSFQSFEIRH